MFANPKVGDDVFVVWQSHRGTGRAPRTETRKVAKVGRKYGYIADSPTDSPFSLATGVSHHGESHIRANGFGFDVYQDQAAWERSKRDSAEHERLQSRIWGAWKIIPLPPDAVDAIHAVLDSAGVRSE